ncbi:MAG: ribose-5-phosphate isomerase RpiA [Caldilineaceae bacterium]
MNSHITQQKAAAAKYAAAYVQSGMVVGLGTGSTATLFLQRLAERLLLGELEDVVGIATSTEIEQEARRLDVSLTTLEDHPIIDLTVDGADEVDPQLNLIKGGGGALLREKIVAQASKREIIIVDKSKLSPLLGTKWHVPVEVVTFGWRTQFDFLTTLGAQVELRETKEGLPFLTDQGNYILDARFGPIEHPAQLAQKLAERTGIVEHGLFIGLASEVIVGEDSEIRVLQPPSRERQ